MIRDFKLYNLAIRDPNLPEENKKKLKVYADRMKFEERSESLEKLAKEFADKPALLAAFNLEITLKGLEPKKELEDMLALTNKNPNIRVDVHYQNSKNFSRILF